MITYASIVLSSSLSIINLFLFLFFIFFNKIYSSSFFSSLFIHHLFFSFYSSSFFSTNFVQNSKCTKKSQKVKNESRFVSAENNRRWLSEEQGAACDPWEIRRDLNLINAPFFAGIGYPLLRSIFWGRESFWRLIIFGYPSQQRGSCKGMGHRDRNRK